MAPWCVTHPSASLQRSPVPQRNVRSIRARRSEGVQGRMALGEIKRSRQPRRPARLRREPCMQCAVRREKQARNRVRQRQQYNRAARRRKADRAGMQRAVGAMLEGMHGRRLWRRAAIVGIARRTDPLGALCRAEQGPVSSALTLQGMRDRRRERHQQDSHRCHPCETLSLRPCPLHGCILGSVRRRRKMPTLRCVPPPTTHTYTAASRGCSGWRCCCLSRRRQQRGTAIRMSRRRASASKASRRRTRRSAVCASPLRPSSAVRWWVGRRAWQSLLLGTRCRGPPRPASGRRCGRWPT
jgi:hypothetical protein